jgi:hypothetical protein
MAQEQRHAAIDDDGGAFGQADARLEAVEHRRQRGTILSIALEDLVRDRKAVAILSAEDYWRLYALLTRAEDAFRDMKTPLWPAR